MVVEIIMARVPDPELLEEVGLTLYERKALMTQLCDGFIALPGGYGTLDELFEALTWQQLAYAEKCIALLQAAARAMLPLPLVWFAAG